MKKLVLATLFSCAHSLEIPEHCQRDSAASPPCVASNPDKKTPPKEANPSDGRFVVHEWGTFTTLVDAEGKTFTWYPLLGSAPLPKFVYSQWFQTIDGKWYNGKGGPEYSARRLPLKGTVRMETPVLYFYSDKERDLSLSVTFNNGYITEWYPHATVPVKNPNVVSWKQFKLTPNAEEKFPTEAAGSEYYAARETDATPLLSTTPTGIQVSTDGKPVLDGVSFHQLTPRHDEPPVQQEKFLFYRGVGSFDVPLGASLVKSDDNEITLSLLNKDAHAIPGAILFYRDGERVWSKRIDGLSIGEAKPATLVLGAPSGLNAVKDALFSLLLEQNLYGREASSMIKTWEEAWFEDGLRVFYIVPKKTTDAILPLAISETPDEIERVLVGRLDVLTPTQREEIKAAAKELREASAHTTDPCIAMQDANAANKLNTLLEKGRFVLPVLEERVSELTDLFGRVNMFELPKEQAEWKMLYALVENPNRLKGCIPTP